MAWAKGIRHIWGSRQSPNNRPEFIKKELSLADARTLPAIRSESSKPQQLKLLLKKLKLCTVICDFRLAQEYGDVDEKKRIYNKSSMLHEISNYLKRNTEWNTLEVITQIFDTISCNLFRPMPDSYHIEHLMGVDHHVPITYTLPSWEHLEIIYEILSITFSNKDIDQLLLTEYIKKYSFIDNFVYLLNTLDKNERNHIQSVLETFHDEHGNIFEKDLIYHLVNYCTDFIHNERGSPEGIQSILNVFNSMSLIDSEIYINILMPLHKMQYKHFRCYEFVLWIYCKRIIEEDESLSLILFYNILKYWPITNAFKEQQFLKKIAVILDFIEEDIWRECDEKNNPKQYILLKRIAYKILYCLQHIHHYKTIIDILDLIEQEEVQDFIDKYGGEHLWCSIYQALYDIITYFFYFETINKTKETMQILKETDDVPMKYKHIFIKIEQKQIRMFPLIIDQDGHKQRKAMQRKRKYDTLRKQAQSTALYRKVQTQKKKEEEQRIQREERKKADIERQKVLNEQKLKRQIKKAKGISTPQLYAAPSPPSPDYVPPKPMNKKGNMPTISLNTLSKSTPPSDRNRFLHIKPEKMGPSPILVETKTQKRYDTNIDNRNDTVKEHRNGNNTIKSMLKKSQSSGSVLRDISPKKRKLPQLPKRSKSGNVLQKEEEDKEQRLQAKREKKEKKKKGRKSTKIKRTRKSIDVDRRSGSISNPVPPQPQTPHFDRFKQIIANNQQNDYLNTQYYLNSVNYETKPLPPSLSMHTPSLAFSYTTNANASISIPITISIKNGRSTPKHNKAQSMFQSSIKSRAPDKKLPLLGSDMGKLRPKKVKSPQTKSMGQILHKFKPLPHSAQNKKLPPLPK